MPHLSYAHERRYRPEHRNGTTRKYDKPKRNARSNRCRLKISPKLGVFPHKLSESAKHLRNPCHVERASLGSEIALFCLACWAHPFTTADPRSKPTVNLLPPSLNRRLDCGLLRRGRGGGGSGELRVGEEGRF